MLYDPMIKKNDLLQYRRDIYEKKEYFIALENQKGWWIKIMNVETGISITELYTSLKVVKCK